MGDTGLRTKPPKRGKNHGLSEAAASGGANVVHSAPGGASWAEVRAVIAACRELPGDVRDYLVAFGDRSVQGDK